MFLGIFSTLHTVNITTNLLCELNRLDDLSPGKDFAEDNEINRLEGKVRGIKFPFLLISPTLQAWLEPPSLEVLKQPVELVLRDMGQC